VPLSGLVPTLLLGPVLGAAAVYGLEKGDIMAAKKDLPQIRKAMRSSVLSAELEAEANHAINSFSRTGSEAARVMEAQMRDLERQMHTGEQQSRR
jgi:hypothetical protein